MQYAASEQVLHLYLNIEMKLHITIQQPLNSKCIRPIDEGRKILLGMNGLIKGFHTVHAQIQRADSGSKPPEKSQQ